MPKFSPLSAQEIQELTARRGSQHVDLTEHKKAIQDVMREGGWGRIELNAGENVRAIKRRTTIAGKELNRIVKWNRKSTPEALLYQDTASYLVGEPKRAISVHLQRRSTHPPARHSR